MSRPWARTFDLIAAEYGWTDEQILDLTMARIRQIREVILARKSETRKERLRVEERKTQYLASTIMSSVGSRRGAREAGKFRLLPPEKVVPTLEQATRRFPVDRNVGGLITKEQILARQRELGLPQRWGGEAA